MFFNTVINLIDNGLLYWIAMTAISYVLMHSFNYSYAHPTIKTGGGHNAYLSGGQRKEKLSQTAMFFTKTAIIGCILTLCSIWINVYAYLNA